MSLKFDRYRTATVLAVAAAMLFATGASQAATASATRKLTKFTFLTNYISTQEYTALIYGIDQGYFKDEGLNVVIEYGSGSSVTAAAMGTGAADLGDTSASVLPVSVGQKVPIKGVGSLEGKNAYGFIVPKSENITSIKGLVGKSILVSTGTAQETLMPAVLRAAGVSPSAVSLDTVSAAARVSSYTQGQGDATAEVLPSEVPIIGNARPSIELPWSQYLPIPDSVFIANDTYLKSKAHKALIRGFLTAYYRSLSQAYTHTAVADADYAKSQPLQNAAANKKAWFNWKSYMCSAAQIRQKDALGDPDLTDWNSLLKFAKTYEGVPASVTLGQILDSEFFAKNDSVSPYKCPDFTLLKSGTSK